jgi:hypothetical protein
MISSKDRALLTKHLRRRQLNLKAEMELLGPAPDPVRVRELSEEADLILREIGVLEEAYSEALIERDGWEQWEGEDSDE